MTTLRSAVLRTLRDRFGIDVHRTSRAAAPGITAAAGAAPLSSQLSKNAVLFDTDEEFHAVYADAVRRSGSGVPRSDRRLYDLVQTLRLTRAGAGPGGLVAECGTFRGLSAAVLCHYLGTEHDDGAPFTGAGVHLFDSFEGLSEPSPEDRIDDPSIPVAGVPRGPGLFRASADDVRATLAAYPDVTLHPGWIPDSFAGAPEGPYRLVHVDVDLHQPTLDALEHFVPRLAAGGVLVCDDYGSIRWPGARQAVDAYVERTGTPRLLLSSGSCLLFGRA